MRVSSAFSVSRFAAMSKIPPQFGELRFEFPQRARALAIGHDAFPGSSL